MKEYRELPKGYETADEIKELKYGGKKSYTPQQIVDRIKHPREGPQTYRGLADYHKSMADLMESGDSAPSRKEYNEIQEHRKREEVYKLLSKKTRAKDAKRRFSDSEMSSFENELEQIAKGLKAIFAIVGLSLGVFFTSSNFTGNIIGVSNSESLGAILFVLGLISAFFYFKSKN